MGRAFTYNFEAYQIIKTLNSQPGRVAPAAAIHQKSDNTIYSSKLLNSELGCTLVQDDLHMYAARYRA